MSRLFYLYIHLVHVNFVGRLGNAGNLRNSSLIRELVKESTVIYLHLHTLLCKSAQCRGRQTAGIESSHSAKSKPSV